MESLVDTVFVTLSDASYYPNAHRTLRQLREAGRWEGDAVLLCVDFEPDEYTRGHLQELRVEAICLQHLDHTPLWRAWETHPIAHLDDNRHYGKVYQWDKLQVFGQWCRRWARVVFLDAGMHVLSEVRPLLELDWRGRLLAPHDGAPRDMVRVFRTQLDLDANPPVAQDLLETFGEEILRRPYFINCCFVFDTTLARAALESMLPWMSRFPIMLCNEMGIMNLYFAMHVDKWAILPTHTEEGGLLFGYSNSDWPGRPPASHFCMLKYPS